MHEASGPNGSPARRRRWAQIPPWAAACLVVLVFGWWVVSLPPFSGLASGAVLVAGVAGVIAGLASRRPEQRRDPVPAAAPWFVLAVAVCLWELQAYVQQPRYDHPTLSSLANALLGSQPARAAAFVLWLLATVELARR